MQNNQSILLLSCSASGSVGAGPTAGKTLNLGLSGGMFSGQGGSDFSTAGATGASHLRNSLSSIVIHKNCVNCLPYTSPTS